MSAKKAIYDPGHCLKLKGRRLGEKEIVSFLRCMCVSEELYSCAYVCT